MRWFMLCSLLLLLALLGGVWAAGERPAGQRPAGERPTGFYGDHGKKDAPVQVLVIVPPSPCHGPAIEMLVKLVKESPDHLRVTVEPMDSENARRLEVSCASYLMKVKGKTPPEGKRQGEYEILFRKSPEVGGWKVEQLEKRVRDAVSQVKAQPKETK